ncbi:hypothetical protein NHX12_024840 [Muraenolepis orangiensis]|uniref:Uncharacterized protein n=1 Tax=Muraenolepis orangiensis TaxID=630683 RepID=A0A9Q0EI95_9TELE|nr:hypothetical protein NHX12_024840 [Muraenolepis orangiensis]
MGMIQLAMEDLNALGGRHRDIENLQPSHPCSTTLSTRGPLSGLATSKPRGSRSSHMLHSATQERPERIGEAEVLGIHHEEA